MPAGAFGDVAASGLPSAWKQGAAVQSHLFVLWRRPVLCPLFSPDFVHDVGRGPREAIDAVYGPQLQKLGEQLPLNPVDPLSGIRGLLHVSTDFSSRVWVLRKAGSCETIMALGSVRMGWFSHTPFQSPRPNNFSSAGTACMQWLTPRKIRHKRPLRRPGLPRFASYAPFEFNLEEPFSHGSLI